MSKKRVGEVYLAHPSRDDYHYRERSRESSLSINLSISRALFEGQLGEKLFPSSFLAACHPFSRKTVVPAGASALYYAFDGNLVSPHTYLLASHNRRDPFPKTGRDDLMSERKE